MALIWFIFLQTDSQFQLFPNILPILPFPHFKNQNQIIRLWFKMAMYKKDPELIFSYSHTKSTTFHRRIHHPHPPKKTSICNSYTSVKQEKSQSTLKWVGEAETQSHHKPHPQLSNPQLGGSTTHTSPCGAKGLNPTSGTPLFKTCISEMNLPHT